MSRLHASPKLNSDRDICEGLLRFNLRQRSTTQRNDKLNGGDARRAKARQLWALERKTPTAHGVIDDFEVRHSVQINSLHITSYLDRRFVIHRVAPSRCLLSLHNHSITTLEKRERNISSTTKILFPVACSILKQKVQSRLTNEVAA